MCLCMSDRFAKLKYANVGKKNKIANPLNITLICLVGAKIIEDAVCSDV